MDRAKIFNGMYGIHSNCINMKITKPHQYVFDKVLSHSIAPFVVKVDRFTPRGVVFISKIRTKGTEIISLRPKVIINNIKDHCNSFCMAYLYKMLKAIRT